MIYCLDEKMRRFCAPRDGRCEIRDGRRAGNEKKIGQVCSPVREI